MQKELLPPADYYPQLENRLKNINATLSQLKKNSDHSTAGHLRIAQKGNVAQFYLYDNPKDFKGHFLPRSQDKLAQELAQKDYNIKAIKELEKEITALENYLRKTGSGSILKEIYDRLSLPVKNLLHHLPSPKNSTPTNGSTSPGKAVHFQMTHHNTGPQKVSESALNPSSSLPTHSSATTFPTVTSSQSLYAMKKTTQHLARLP